MKSHYMGQDSQLRDRTIAIGPFLSGHLGDTLCLTPIVRQLSCEANKIVLLWDSIINRTVFENNPYASGFTKKPTSNLYCRLGGNGHIIQRLQYGLDLPIDAKPRPEIFLSNDEASWATLERGKWETSKPVCVLSTRCISDARQMSRAPWADITDELCKQFTIVQPIITDRTTYLNQTSRIGVPIRWSNEFVSSKSIIYENLSLRRLFALFMIADAYVGGPSGGSHVAAAFAKPAIIIAWPQLLRSQRISHACQRLTQAAFLYPNQIILSFDRIFQRRGGLFVLHAEMGRLLRSVAVGRGQIETRSETMCMMRSRIQRSGCKRFYRIRRMGRADA